MALAQRQDEIRANVRKFSNTQGTTALLRHPDADLNDYINRALGSLHRRLTTAMPDQRILASTLVTMEADVTAYPLPALFDCLISVEITLDGHKHWLQAYEMSERPVLASTDTQRSGRPFCYRLRAANIDFLPTPDAAYVALLWYVPAASQLTGDGQTYDTISRLDDYIIAYAARPIAIKDKNWDLVAACKSIMDELGVEIDALARNRDRNSPPRIVDTYQADRWGRPGGRRSR